MAARRPGGGAGLTGVSNVSSRPLVLAHRGGALEAPENSIESFERAIALGCDGVELDVRCSRDGVPLVVHDREVKTHPGAQWRPVDQLTAGELRFLPTLDAVLGLPWGDMTLMVEVKHDRDAHGRNRELAVVVARAIRKTRLPNAVLASFSVEMLVAAHAAEPSVPLVPILDDETYYEEDLNPLEKLPIFGWAADLGWLQVDEASVAWMRGRGGVLWVWTVKTLGEFGGALGLQADGVITDIPGQVIERLAQTRS
jgi:glycerophosphoryl diester phosphodiesterase